MIASRTAQIISPSRHYEIQDHGRWNRKKTQVRAAVQIQMAHTSSFMIAGGDNSPPYDNLPRLLERQAQGAIAHERHKTTAQACPDCSLPQ